MAREFAAPAFFDGAGRLGEVGPYVGAVCLLASLLSCPNPDTGAQLHPVTEQTRSIESEAQAAAPVAARFGRDEAQGTIAARFGRDEGAGTIAARQTVAVIYSHFDESSKSGDAYASLEPSPEQTQSIAREFGHAHRVEVRPGRGRRRLRCAEQGSR